MKVKICANKNIEDAKICIDAGADMIGILVGQTHVSSDFVSKEVAKTICEFAQNKCDIVLVTHLTDANSIIELTQFIGNNYIQLHSNIEESQVEKIHFCLPNIKLIRVLHLNQDGTLLTNFEVMKYVDYFLLDSINTKTDQVGGTGISYDWNKAGNLIKRLTKPTFLAGGLNPNNVQQAINDAHPYGVDVNSGCKTKTKKDKDKVLNFVKNAKLVQTYDKKIIQ